MKRPLTFMAILLAGPAAAQDTGWSFAGSLYGSIPGMSTSVDVPFGTVDGDVSGGDALSALDMAFMGAFEARRGRWGLLGDLLYANLSADQDTPFGAFSSAEIETKLTAFSGYALYRVSETPRAAVDLGGGFRAFGLDLDTSLEGDAAEGRSFSDDADWVVPLATARAIIPFNEKWFATTFADVGGLSGSDMTWQLFASVGYRFNERWSTQLGYRYMDIEKEIDGDDVSLELYGPLAGFTARF